MRIRQFELDKVIMGRERGGGGNDDDGCQFYSEEKRLREMLNI